MTEPTPVHSDDRPLPFILRVAAEWLSLAEIPPAADGPLLFRPQAALTGDLAVTAQGRDIQFSDLGVPR